VDPTGTRGLVVTSRVSTGHDGDMLGVDMTPVRLHRARLFATGYSQIGPVDRSGRGKMEERKAVRVHTVQHTNGDCMGQQGKKLIAKLSYRLIRSM